MRDIILATNGRDWFINVDVSSNKGDEQMKYE